MSNSRVLQRCKLGKEPMELEDEAYATVAEGRELGCVHTQNVLPIDNEAARVWGGQGAEDL